MINISLPTGIASHRYILIGQSWLSGPYKTSPPDIIPSRYHGDLLTQGSEMYGEKEVYNDQLQADISFYSASPDISTSPTPEYPNRIWYKYRVGAQTTSTLLNHGVADDTKVSPDYSSNQVRIYNVCTGNGTNDLVIYQVTVYRTAPGMSSEVQTVVETRYHTNNVGDTSAVFTGLQRFYRLSTALAKSFSWIWDGAFTADILIAMITSFTSLVTPVSVGPYTWTVGRLFSSPTANPKDALAVVDSCYDSFLKADLTPLAEKDFGTLAADASMTLVANDVNMLEFIRDIRHPSEMIPKLRNLTSLKTHAANFLAIDYGVLPTISDLKDIVKAMRKTKTHLDLNSFRTCTAGYSKSSTLGSDIQCDLTQRIKIALTDEDSMLLQLANTVDSMGFYPSMENLWDLVPYSFVLDWFINVGDMLQRADNGLRLQRYDIKYVTMSRKLCFTKTIRPSSTSPYTGTVKLVQYHRWVSGRCPVPPLFLATPYTASSHWLEAAAMLIQRRK